MSNFLNVGHIEELVVESKVSRIILGGDKHKQKLYLVTLAQFCLLVTM